MHWFMLWMAAAPAYAQSAQTPWEGSRWGGSVWFQTSLVAGPVNAGGTASTLTGDVTFDATFTPRLDLAVGGSLMYRPYKGAFIAASWSMSRDVVFDDRTDDFRPGTGGTSTPNGLETSDLSLTFRDMSVASQGKTALTAGARGVIPLSRESLLCNPRYGALGLDVGVRFDASQHTTLLATASADRAFYQHAAAPRGACGQKVDAIDTLTGPVTATPAPDTFATLPNPAWTFDQGVAVIGWHGVFAKLPGISDKAMSAARTSVSVGVREQLRAADPATSVQTDTGAVDVDRAATPAVVSVPFSVSAGAAIDQHTELRLTLSNRLPALLADPAARLRVLPATTTATVSISGTW